MKRDRLKKVEHWCNQTIVTAEATASTQEMGELMREYSVSEVVVVRQAGTLITPIGIVTRRDLAVSGLYTAAQAEKLTAGDVMSRRLLTVRESDDLGDALAEMRARNVRRAPVVNDEGELVGILLLRELLPEMPNIANVFFDDGPGDAAANDTAGRHGNFGSRGSYLPGLSDADLSRSARTDSHQLSTTSETSELTERCCSEEKV